jgi:hypothetical protein
MASGRARPGPHARPQGQERHVARREPFYRVSHGPRDTSRLIIKPLGHKRVTAAERKSRQRNLLPRLNFFLQKRLPQKGYPLSAGRNRFWTGFWERGREQFSESKSPPYRGVASAARTSKLV